MHRCTGWHTFLSCFYAFSQVRPTVSLITCCGCVAIPALADPWLLTCNNLMITDGDQHMYSPFVQQIPNFYMNSKHNCAPFISSPKDGLQTRYHCNEWSKGLEARLGLPFWNLSKIGYSHGQMMLNHLKSYKFYMNFSCSSLNSMNSCATLMIASLLMSRCFCWQKFGHTMRSLLITTSWVNVTLVWEPQTHLR